jgi:signal transduction histidine kinase
VHSQHPPPIRVEWLIGATRGALALSVVVELWSESRLSPQIDQWLFAYLAYSIGLLALMWKPARFTTGWAVAVQTFDVIAFSLFAAFAAGAGIPVLFYFLFVVICGTLRWQSIGAMWTAAGVIGALGGAYVYGAFALGIDTLDAEMFVRNSVHFAATAALVGYLGTYPHPLEGGVSRVALWPRKLPRNSRALLTDIIARSTDVLETPSVLLVWSSPNQRHLNLAWQSTEGLVWIREPEGTYGSLVAPELESHSFQAFDAPKDNGRVIHWSGGRLRHRRCRALNESLRARFEMRRVQSYRLDGEFTQGRLFCFGKRRMQIDDLIVGDFVARLAVSQLDSLYLISQMGEGAALEERLRVARDLHDSLAQTLAGTALQLLAARRLLDFNPVAARQRLDEVQHQLKRDQLEVRSLIRRLRPAARTSPESVAELEPRIAGVREQLEQLRLRVEKQWDVTVAIQFDAPTDHWPNEAVEQIFRLIQEAVLNAARHADASVVRVDVTSGSAGLRLAIEDDGKGYPFHGTFDLAALTEMQKGPLTLRERVAALGGGLQLQTSTRGTRLAITLPNALVET